MPTRKIPPEAFTYYVGLGTKRSYAKVAERYGVTKRTVTRHAAKHKWSDQTKKIEAEAQATAAENARSEIEAAHERHMKALRLVFGKGFESPSKHDDRDSE